MTGVEVGDFVAFRVQEAGAERRCKDIHVIASCHAPDLPDSIRNPRVAIPIKTRIPLLHLCSSRD